MWYVCLCVLAVVLSSLQANVDWTDDAFNGSTTYELKATRDIQPGASCQYAAAPAAAAAVSDCSCCCLGLLCTNHMIHHVLMLPAGVSVAWLCASCGIMPGEELFLTYGDAFWFNSITSTTPDPVTKLRTSSTLHVVATLARST